MAEGLWGCPLPLSEKGQLRPHISWSHTRKALGVAFARDPGFSVGLDLEWAHRCHEKLIERISSPGERRGWPQNLQAAIWAIKESAFKAFYKGVKPPISRITQVKLQNFEGFDGWGCCQVSYLNHRATTVYWYQAPFWLAITGLPLSTCQTKSR